ncbi:zinc finger protein 862-like [Pecten maximus]|uniref:zinc finger protein 862-like n=1 Tax=Pecten maximus TaxID=6579 RepID=UPI00145901A3|nr:zinc finger protein 862-like [Pecten maximus]
MCKNNIAADNFCDLMELQRVNGCSAADDYYKKPEIIVEMETAIADVIEKNVINDIKNSPFFGVMLDETCDISVGKKLVICVRYIKEGKVVVAYIGNKQITDCTANGIKTSLCEFLILKDLVQHDDFSKLIGLGTDGASVMIGCKNGLGVKLKAKNEELVQVHCVAHRLNLAASQAGKGIPYLEDYKTFIHSLYKFYNDSSFRYDKLRELQELLHGKAKQVPEGTSVRWLSVEAAVKMIYTL